MSPGVIILGWGKTPPPCLVIYFPTRIIIIILQARSISYCRDHMIVEWSSDLCRRVIIIFSHKHIIIISKIVIHPLLQLMCASLISILCSCRLMPPPDRNCIICMQRSTTCMKLQRRILHIVRWSSRHLLCSASALPSIISSSIHPRLFSLCSHTLFVRLRMCQFNEITTRPLLFMVGVNLVLPACARPV